MYSRKTGIMYNPTETQRKIESFNSDLREQYHKKSSSPVLPSTSVATNTNNDANALVNLLKNDDIIILALIVVLLFEESKDYLLIGVLAMLLFLK